MAPPLRLPVEVRRSAKLDTDAQTWQAWAEEGRGGDGRRAGQRLKELHRIERLLPSKPFLGRHVPRQLIPARLRKQGVTNLFRNDLPDGWRLLHTLVEVDGVQAVILLEALDHSAYDRLFGYRGR